MEEPVVVSTLYMRRSLYHTLGMSKTHGLSHKSQSLLASYGNPHTIPSYLSLPKICYKMYSKIFLFLIVEDLSMTRMAAGAVSISNALSRKNGSSCSLGLVSSGTITHFLSWSRKGKATRV